MPQHFGYFRFPSGRHHTSARKSRTKLRSWAKFSHRCGVVTRFGNQPDRQGTNPVTRVDAIGSRNIVGGTLSAAIGACACRSWGEPRIHNGRACANDQGAIRKTKNRSVVGVMNQFSYLADGYREYLETRDLPGLSIKLAETPCSALYKGSITASKKGGLCMNVENFFGSATAGTNS